jgi:hypothetical protein
MLRRSCLSEKEVMRLGLRRCDQAHLDSRYLGHYSSIWRFKKIMSASFFVNFYRRLTMCGGDTSNLLKASSSLADDCYGE